MFFRYKANAFTITVSSAKQSNKVNRSSQLPSRDFDRDTDTIRTMLLRENDLINNRVTWMATFQGLLFTALGFAWDKAFTGRLVLMFGLLGIFVAIFSLIGLVAATASMCKLRSWWKSHKPVGYDGPQVEGLTTINDSLWINQIVFWNFFPLLFMSGWGIVLWINHIRHIH